VGTREALTAAAPYYAQRCTPSQLLTPMEKDLTVGSIHVFVLYNESAFYAHFCALRNSANERAVKGRCTRA